MAQCKNSVWTINMSRDSATPPQPLVFELQISAAGTISGEVFAPGTVASISQVTGTCQPVDNPDGTVMTLSFVGGAVDIFMVGFTHVVGPFNRFNGRFIATARPDNAPLEIPPAMAAFAAGPGDTGTGTGQQT